MAVTSEVESELSSKSRISMPMVFNLCEVVLDTPVVGTPE
jgi:hypothetical protein